MALPDPLGLSYEFPELNSPIECLTPGSVPDQTMMDTMMKRCFPLEMFLYIPLLSLLVAGLRNDGR